MFEQLYPCEQITKEFATQCLVTCHACPSAVRYILEKSANVLDELMLTQLLYGRIVGLPRMSISHTFSMNSIAAMHLLLKHGATLTQEMHQVIQSLWMPNYREEFLKHVHNV